MDSGEITGIVISLGSVAAILVICVTWIHKRSELKKLQIESGAAFAQDDRLREMNEQALAAQRVTSSELTNLRQQYQAIEQRLATIEQLLKDVDG